MKQLGLLLFTFFSVFVYGQKIESKKIYSQILNQERAIWIYTPSEFDDYPDKKFEVIFVFDAQSREFFDFVHSSLSFIKPNGTSYVVVGITSPYNKELDYSRNNDMLPVPNHLETIAMRGNYLGNADNFLDFIYKELVPYLETNYRILPTRIAVGHSNGATFIVHCLLKQPGLFSAYIALSPNLAYDQEQMVERLKGLNEQTFERKKFVFFSNASEGVDTDYEGWEEAREKVYKILQDRKLSDKVFFEKKEFPKESHWSSFAPGLLAGMKAYFDYQYYDVDRLLAYLDMLKQKYPEALSPDEVNQLGYNFFNVHKTPNALKVLLWANQIFPDDLNLYDSVGEMYQHLDNKKEAMNYYTLFESKLEERKDILDPEEYEYLKNGVLGRIKHLLEMK